jgi:peptide/nickel transport system substrate-binding protein
LPVYVRWINESRKNFMFHKRWALWALLFAITAVVLAACGPQTETMTVAVTRVVNETVSVTGEAAPVTRVVVETETVTVEVEVEEENGPPARKDLVICMAQEPATLFPYAGGTLAQTAVMHAIFENNYTTLAYDYQPRGLEKIPSLADGDAVVDIVEAAAGDLVVDAAGAVTPLAAGVELINAAGETVVFDGAPVSMAQMIVDFSMKPRVWSDGTPVTAADSVYSFHIAADPDTQTNKFVTARTARYEATADLRTRWVGIPGFLDSTYFLNFWMPLPEHAWGEFAVAELSDIEESSRFPMGDGPFKIQEWIPGDRIYLTPNEYYYVEEQPYLDSVTFRFVSDTNQLVARLLSGTCDIGTQDGLDVGQSPFLISAEADGSLTPYFQTGTLYEHIDFGINSYGGYGDDIGRPDWFEDVRVRQAMTMCTDRQGMVDRLMYGRSEVIHSYIPAVHPLYPETLTEWPYDVNAANTLLDQVGFLDTDGDGIREYAGGPNGEFAGEPFIITLAATTGREMVGQLTLMFRANMRDCGIEVNLYYLPSRELFANGPSGPLFGRAFDLAEFAWSTGVEPGCSLYQSSEITGPADEINPNHYMDGATFAGWGGASNTGWVNEEFDAACKRALGALPGTEDYEMGHKDAQRIFSQELPVIPLFLRLKVAVPRPEVLNFTVDPTQSSELYNLYEIDLQR